jgi:TRAP-type C4-dicarboxylate transport system permease large subunit
MDFVIAVLLGNLMQYGTIINNVFGIAEAFFKRMPNY